jgi:hypothetical protein
VGGTPEEAEAPGAIATPLAAGARDAVTALFFARTLPFAEGVEVAMPVNDGGRNLVVRLRVEGVETITTPAGTGQARRLQVGIERRLERRQGLGATLWVSTDARRVPVRLDLSAGFGQVRVELVDYRP